MAPITKLTEDRNFSLDKGMSEGLGIDQIKVYWSINIDITKLAGGILCSYRCVLVSCGGYVVLECKREEWSTNIICS